MITTRGEGRVAALDGIRALAVAAVVAFHLDERAVPGGYLGVDVFFVLSGFLITSLLIGEWEARGGVDLRAFWRRRARRLLPPLVLTVAGIALVVPLLYEDVAGRVRGQAVAALLQGANWFEAAAGRSYFEDIGRPPPLRHLWSLGVEAQFYAVWPVVAVTALALGGRRLLAAAAGVGAAASFGALALAFTPDADPSRLYYGTDTRAGTLLVGALLACVLPLGERRHATPRAVFDVAGVAGVAGVTVLAFALEGTSPAAYRGGFLLAALLTAVVLAVATHPESILGSFLTRRSLLWLGTRSYAIYLWHWPVLTATRPGLDLDVHGWPLLALRLGLTAVLAEGTTRLVAVALQPRPVFGPSVRHRLVVGGGIACAAVLGAGLAGSAQAPASQPVFYVSPTTSLAPTTSTSTSSTTTSTTTTVAVPVPTTTTTTTVPPVLGPIRAVAVGESVLMGAGGQVQRALGPGTIVDADVARQPEHVLDALEARRKAGHLEGIDVLVVQLGTNGQLRGKHVERLAALVAGVPRVVAVTVLVPKSWQDASNAALRDAAARFPWLRLADWHAAASQHPEWLGPDGVHVGREGARQYAAILAAAVSAP